MRLTLPAPDFAALQDELGLDNAALSARLFRGPDRSDLIGCYRAGTIEVPLSVAFALRGMARESEGMGIAA